MFHNYDDWVQDELILDEELLNKPQETIKLLFENIGIYEKPIMSLAHFRKRGSFNVRNTVWEEEIFQRKLIINKENIFQEFFDVDKVIRIEDLLLPQEKNAFVKNLAEEYFKELKIISNKDYNWFCFRYVYEDVVGGDKNSITIYEDDKPIEIPPQYGVEDGLVTILNVSKKIIDGIENHPFLNEFFNLITSYIFSSETSIEVINNLLVKVGMVTLNERIYKSFLGEENTRKNVNVFDMLHNISLLKYESSENKGNILFCTREIELENKIILSKPVSLIGSNSAKAIRKLLEISNEDICLLCDGVNIFGIGKRSVGQNLPLKSFMIEFKGQGEWDVLNFNNKRIMSVAYKVPSLPKQAVKEPEFAKKFQETFHSSSYQSTWNFINFAKNQTHGTMVVITNDAEAQAKRLSKQSFSINKIDNIDGSMVERITAIDGAVLLDEKGACYAIGIILDGIANDKIGTISRGARYNSALRYLNYCKENDIACMIVIVSEDKYVDIKTIFNLLD